MLDNPFYTCIHNLLLIFDNRYDIHIRTHFTQTTQVEPHNGLSCSRQTTDRKLSSWNTGFNSHSPDSVSCGRSKIHCTVCLHNSVPLTVSHICIYFNC